MSILYREMWNFTSKCV